jgi:multiple sugar transport system ATP-binding protein
MNLFDVDIVEGGVQFGTATVKVDRNTLAGATGKRVTLGIRPEDLTLSNSGKGLQTSIDLVEELGADGYVYGSAEVNGQNIDMVVRVDGRNHPDAGDKVALLPIEHHIHVFDTATGVRLTKEAISATS